jgi:hypothetical protein
MPHLPPGHHETSKRDSPNEIKIKVKPKQNKTFSNTNSNLAKSMTHHNQTKEWTTWFLSSPPHVHFLKSPHTTPPLQNPPNAPKKLDAIVDEPSKDPKNAVERFYDVLKKYKIKKSLEDLDLEGMTVEEFWQHGDKDYKEFEYGKSLVPKHVHLKLLWSMQKFLERYFLACVYKLNFVEVKIPGEIFNTLDFDLNVDIAELHTIFHL